MHRISTGLSMVLIGAVFACLVMPVDRDAGAGTPAAGGRSDVTAAGVDPMPVGTAGKVDRARRAKAAGKI